MAQKERVFVDETEIVAGIAGQRVSIHAADVMEITVSEAEVRKLFGKELRASIVFKMKKEPIPTVITKEKSDEKYWVGYITQIEKFCKKNRIRFTDATASAGKPMA